MKKKINRWSLFLILIVILVIILGLLIKYGIEEKQQRDAEKQHERLMEESLEEISYINKNSNFAKIELMGEPLDDYLYYNYFGAFGNGKLIVGGYYCSEFNGKYCITDISLDTRYIDLLGISLKDSYDKAVDVMEERGYTCVGQQEESYKGGYGIGYVYKKAYITILLTVSEDNVIEDIYIAIMDPYNKEQIKMESREKEYTMMKTRKKITIVIGIVSSLIVVGFIIRYCIRRKQRKI